MSDVALYLFDDLEARSWAPVALTRPAGELLFGTLLQRERAERFWGAECRGHVVGAELVGFEEAGAPPVTGLSDVRGDGPTVFFSSRAVPLYQEAPDLDEAATLVMDGAVVGWFLPDGAESITEEQLRNPDEAEIGGRIGLDGSVLAHSWDLVVQNNQQLLRDIRARFPTADPPAGREGLHIIGDGVVSLGESVVIEPQVVFDTTEGGIRLDDGVTVKAFTRLAGPAYAGPGTMLLGGSVSDVSIGPGCNVGGEVAHTIVLGNANKAHDGFLGHAYVGRWVNLGAGTTNSNLRNDYGTVRVQTAAGGVDTELFKLGCLIGDHVKTGIGTMLNTGTVVGAGSNLFGGMMPPSLVPPFSWGAGTDLVEYRLDKFLEVAERVMSRRGVELTDGMRALLGGAWERSRPDRS